MNPTPKGTYVIVLRLDHAPKIHIGKLGRVHFKKGWYAYVGSAFGPGGLKSRLNRHIAPKKNYHWHIDYLNPEIIEVWVSDPGEHLEHDWANALGNIASDRIPKFGCSDCSCESHLFRFNTPAFLTDFQKELSKKSPVQILDADLELNSTAPIRAFRLHKP
jgi:Uri superfamily endonuclease